MESSRELFETTPSYIAGYVWLRCRACGAEMALAEHESPPLSCPTCGGHSSSPRSRVPGQWNPLSASCRGLQGDAKAVLTGSIQAPLGHRPGTMSWPWMVPPNRSGAPWSLPDIAVGGQQRSLEAHLSTELRARPEAVRALMSTKDAPRGQGEITSVVNPNGATRAPCPARQSGGTVSRTTVADW